MCPAGLYLHIPFCVRKCPYCDFFSIQDESLAAPFIDALIGEMGLVETRSLEFDTVYLGGGTPSLLKTGDIGRIIDNARKAFHILPRSEITIEINPRTVSSECFEAYMNYGINRVNIGVQSFNGDNLAFLGRIHSSGEAALAVDSARKAGFENLGTDQSDLRDSILDAYKETRLTPPYFKELVGNLSMDAKKGKDVLMLLVSEGSLVKVKEELFFHINAVNDLKKRLVSFLEENGEITTPQFKEMTGASRKYVIPLIEYFDSIQVTLRIGDIRKLRKG